VERAKAQGVQVRVISLRLLAPLQVDALAAALEGVERVMVVEQNHGAQLLHYLRGAFDLPGRPASFHRPGPLPLRPADICNALVEWAAQEETATP
jgi:2-oxoglutarate ferredoxin oxidoreductase subunit alpha